MADAMWDACGSIPSSRRFYDHVLRSAKAVVAVGTVAERAIQRGVSPDGIIRGGGFVVSDDPFAPEGPKLDIAALQAESTADPSSAISYGAISLRTGPISESTQAR
jgi:hypothetical protein